MTKLHPGLAAALALAASVGPASAKVEDNHPLQFNTPYTPARNVRPKLAGGRVYVALSQYKNTFYDGAQCLVREGNAFAIGACAKAAVFNYVSLANGFRLKLDEKCLGVSGDGVSLVAGDCANTLSLDAVSAGAVIDKRFATGYDRNVLRVGQDTKEYRVFAKEHKAGPTLEIKPGPVELADVEIGLTITSCLVDTCNPTVDVANAPKSAIPGLAARLAGKIANITELKNRPNIVLFFIDTLRADAVTSRLAPAIARLAKGLPFDRAFAGATSTIQSTYTLLNMRPGFEQEWSMTGDPENKALFGGGGVALAILQKLGYKAVLFSRPDWYETFLWSKDLGLESNGYSPTAYSLELPIRARLAYEQAAEVANAEELMATKEARTGITGPTLNYKIKTSELATMTLALHDRLVVDELKRYIEANKQALGAGGHVLIVYLTGPHAPHVPAEGIVKGGKLALPARGDLSPDLYLGDAARELSVAVSLVKTTDGLVGAGDNPPPWLVGLSEDARRERLAQTYYNQVRLVDREFERAMTAYAAVEDNNYFVAVMGDHGESLWENGVIFHGGRPAQKVVEAPIILDHVVNGERHEVEIGLDRTVAQMDLFPALFRTITQEKDVLTRWGIAGDVLGAERRDGCYISSEPNADRDSRRFATFDAKSGVKSLFLATNPKGVLDATSFALTHVTDYFDDPIAASMVDARRCFDVVMRAAYKL
jgi:hypothetical protein